MLRRSAARLARFVRMRRSERWCLVEAGLFLTMARAAVHWVPFRWVARGLRLRQLPTLARTDPNAQVQIQRVGRAIRVISRHLPGEISCLAQALAGQLMLRRRRIGSLLMLGLAKDAQGQLSAHAWLRSGDQIVTGGQGHERYRIVATFSTPG